MGHLVPPGPESRRKGGTICLRSMTSFPGRGGGDLVTSPSTHFTAPLAGRVCLCSRKKVNGTEQSPDRVSGGGRRG